MTSKCSSCLVRSWCVDKSGRKVVKHCASCFTDEAKLCSPQTISETHPASSFQVSANPSWSSFHFIFQVEETWPTFCPLVSELVSDSQDLSVGDNVLLRLAKLRVGSYVCFYVKSWWKVSAVQAIKQDICWFLDSTAWWSPYKGALIQLSSTCWLP